MLPDPAAIPNPLRLAPWSGKRSWSIFGKAVMLSKAFGFVVRFAVRAGAGRMAIVAPGKIGLETARRLRRPDVDGHEDDTEHA